MHFFFILSRNEIDLKFSVKLIKPFFCTRNRQAEFFVNCKVKIYQIFDQICCEFNSRLFKKKKFPKFCDQKSEKYFPSFSRTYNFIMTNDARNKSK